MAGPLDGIRVLDLSSVGPASRCTRILADYGAEVIKVFPVGHGNPTSDENSEHEAAVKPDFYAYSGLRGMRITEMNLKSKEGNLAFFSLVTKVDVLIESFRPGVAERLGIGFEKVRNVNPTIVYCSTSGYGQSGPRARSVGHDIDYLGIGGFLATSEPRGDGGPPIPGATVADAAAGGMHAALAITTALFERDSKARGCSSRRDAERRGDTSEGTYLDVSVTDGVLWLMSLAIDEHLALGSHPRPGHDILTGRFACYGTYKTKDGSWLAVGAIEHKFFANLCDALECARWKDHQFDDRVQDAIRSDFTCAFASKSREEWMRELEGTDTCVAPVLSVSEVVADEQSMRRQVTVTADHLVHGSFTQLAPLMAGMPRPIEPVVLPDPRSTDTTNLLRECGVDSPDVARWLELGVIR